MLYLTQYLREVEFSPSQKWDNLKITQFVNGLIQINECRIFRVPDVVRMGHAKIINRNGAIIIST